MHHHVGENSDKINERAHRRALGSSRQTRARGWPISRSRVTDSHQGSGRTTSLARAHALRPGTSRSCSPLKKKKFSERKVTCSCEIEHETGHVQVTPALGQQIRMRSKRQCATGKSKSSGGGRHPRGQPSRQPRLWMNCSTRSGAVVLWDSGRGRSLCKSFRAAVEYDYRLYYGHCQGATAMQLILR